MEIRVHTQGGSVETFIQDDPVLADRILKDIRPATLFAADVITIAGDYSLTTFLTSRINRVDLVSTDCAPWKYPADVLDVVELSEDEFRQRSHLNDPARLEKRQSPKRAGEFALVFGEVEMADGKRILLAAKIMVALPVERLQRLRTLFSAPAVHFRLRQGGAAILNLKNLVRVTFNPGPDRAPIGAWPAHHLPRREASGRIAETYPIV
jgi:hypothetical protein